AADVAPGLLRHGLLPPTRWRGFDFAGWRALCDEARSRETAGLTALRPVFAGSDIDPQAIRAARENEAMAGLAGLIRWDVAAVEALQVVPEPLRASAASQVEADPSSRHPR
ncbi:hypothetical protein JTP77_041875, partial [Streptomyces sp. S9]|nr:hypothetical protein [Streptomyces sp. S9]